jgi:selT/selW/selH-like putative selenoprotein
VAASLKSRFSEDAQIKAGRTGQFDVVVDGKLIFSKAEAGRFPVEGEVEERFAALRDGKELPPIEKQSGGAIRRIVDRLMS